MYRLCCWFLVGLICALFAGPFAQSRLSTSSHTMRIEEDGTVYNWFGNVKWKPRAIHSPGTLQELQKILADLNETNEKRVEKGEEVIRARAVGRLHSWSKCAEIDGGVMIRTEGLSKVLHVDKKKMTVKSEAGIAAHELWKELHKHELALPTLPNVIQVSLGGMVSNAVHGTMKDSGTFSSFVIEIELVDYKGDLLRISRNDVDPEKAKLFDAAVVSGGNLGVIYSVTLQCIPDYNVIVHATSISVEEIEGRIAELMTETPSLAMMLTETGSSGFKSLFPVSPLLATPAPDFFLAFRELVGECYAISINELNSERFWWKYRIGLAIRYVVNHPSLTTFIKDRFKVMTWDDGETVVKVWKDRAFVSFEFQVPLENSDEARRLYLKRVREFRASGLYDRRSPIFLRCTHGDSRGFLSPTRGNSTHYVSFDLPYQKMDENEIAFYKAFEEDIIGLGAKLSWSRDANSPPEKILKGFPDVDKFVEVMKEIDPHGVFSNGLRKKLFGR